MAHAQLNPQQQERSEQMKKAVEEAISRLADQLAQGHSEEFLNLLKFYSAFWKYSPRNLILIRCQRPDATQVAGYQTWKRLGRQVRQGARAIYVWAPVTKVETDPETGLPHEICVGFRPATVFAAEDLVDIEENPLPSLTKALPDDVTDLYNRCVARIEAEGITVQEKIMPPGVQGSSRGGEFIFIHRKLDSRNRLFTLIHELVHNRWHQRNREREDVLKGQREFEAESVAYVVAATLGLEHPGARDYLLHWGATPEQLTTSLGVIQRLVKDVCRILKVEEESDAAG